FGDQGARENTDARPPSHPSALRRTFHLAPHGAGLPRRLRGVDGKRDAEAARRKLTPQRASALREGLLELPGMPFRIDHKELRAARAEEVLRLAIVDAEAFHALAERFDIRDEPRRVAAGRGIFRAGAGLVILLRGDEVELHLVVGIPEPGAAADIIERLRPLQELQPEHLRIEIDAGIEILMADRNAFMHRA